MRKWWGAFAKRLKAWRAENRPVACSIDANGRVGSNADAAIGSYTREEEHLLGSLFHRALLETN
eukprot:8590354-Alexandrium_andersonii.AAC.1